MSVNGVTGSVAAYSVYSGTSKVESDTSSASAANQTKSEEQVNASGVVYEPGKDADIQKAKTYTPNVDLVNKLKADAEARTSQLRSLVEKLISGQGNAIGNADDIWSFLRTGNFTVDAETKAQAQADIAEDGYWGVEQTSERILDFAKALSGGDPSKAEELKDAFVKGFKQATKTWGGELPEISQRTYDATIKKFEDWAANVAE